ncbi:hypothetical protein DFJ58DRAFT_869203 [Suillus subalutaceus]|uniref:uncharacterized protein n=1 Tax=Suillus subalutaceus TaxID=48586 RepID=UPI001B861E18|nr:uncharacterized protein DFJ58DRAFT_869203 [Suillus subalutaceus]KAG1834020.1 hypothetical protein DFJ58DRAFT_869203 [Suillus subalutaceus]
MPGGPWSLRFGHFESSSLVALTPIDHVLQFAEHLGAFMEMEVGHSSSSSSQVIFVPGSTRSGYQEDGDIVLDDVFSGATTASSVNSEDTEPLDLGICISPPPLLLPLSSPTLNMSESLNLGARPIAPSVPGGGELPVVGLPHQQAISGTLLTSPGRDGYLGSGHAHQSSEHIAGPSSSIGVEPSRGASSPLGGLSPYTPTRYRYLPAWVSQRSLFSAINEFNKEYSRRETLGFGEWQPELVSLPGAPTDNLIPAAADLYEFLARDLITHNITEQREPTQTDLDGQPARHLMLDEKQAAQNYWRPGSVVQAPAPPGQDAMAEFQDGFNKIAETGKKTFSSIVSKVSEDSRIRSRTGSVQVQPPNKVRRFLGKVKDGVTKISRSNPKNVCSRELVLLNVDREPAWLTSNIEVQDTPSGVKQGADPQSVDTALQDALDAADQMNALLGPARSGASAGQYPPATLDDMDDIETTYLQPLRIFDTVIGKVAEVHPYAKMALSVLSRASKASWSATAPRPLPGKLVMPIIEMVDGLLRRRRMTDTYYICATTTYSATDSHPIKPTAKITCTDSSYNDDPAKLLMASLEIPQI